ncbi:MAG: thiamine pyrophosphate-dependent enzyme [Verrucomicrobiota bacterium]|jgi:acetolactate synthase-1/2/3 large subunit
MLNGETASQIAEWLNTLPEAKAALDAEFDGQAINEINLSNWKLGGYREWELQQEALEAVRRLGANAAELNTESGGQMADQMAACLTARIAIALQKLPDEGEDPAAQWQRLRLLCGDLVALRKGDHNAQWLRLEREKLDLDLIPDDHPLCFGRPGSLAPRGANFTLQNSDLLLVVGSRLDMAMTAYAHDRLARGAQKVMVDIDPAEIGKMKTPIHLPIVADAAQFLGELARQAGGVPGGNWTGWVQRCQEWKAKYPLVLPEHRDGAGPLSMYHFSEALSDAMAEGDVIAPGSSGFAIEIFLLCLKIKRGQRCFHNRGTGSMGFGLPAAIGAAVASGTRTICVEGDGGFQMNAQELATVERLGLPLKIFVANNDGYASIRASQLGYFKLLTGADRTSGVTLPDLEAVTRAYGLPFLRISCKDRLQEQIRQVLESQGPILCEVMVAANEDRIPRASSYIKPDGSMGSKPLEDLFPFLDRAEFKKNMLIPTIEE